MSHWTPTYTARLAAGASSVGVAVDTCFETGEMILRAMAYGLSVVLAEVRRRRRIRGPDHRSPVVNLDRGTVLYPRFDLGLARRRATQLALVSAAVRRSGSSR